MKKHKNITSRRLLIISLIVGCTALGIALLLWQRSGKQDKSRLADPISKTTSTAPTAQADFNDGGDRTVSRTNKQEGTVNDTNGRSVEFDRSKAVTSKDEKILVGLPVKDSILRSGDELIGESTLENVHFRLIDDVSGVISQGSLKVTNGKFSGKFSFSTSGTNGRLDIFNLGADGIESSTVEIPIRFK